MAKLSRTVLKGIVKECLVEIMEEAFSPLSNSQMQNRLNESKERNHSKFDEVNSTQYSQKSNMFQSNQQRQNHLDKISFGKENKKVNPNFNKKVDQVANSMTSDPVLADIFKDTAMTTLQEQVMAEKGNTMLPAGAGDKAARAASINNPSDLFGEAAAGKWAQLAFSENIGK